jgi:O-succinylbenzoate synthase
VTPRAHHLKIGERAVTLLEGPAGWGECSPFAGYPCDPDAARRAAVEAACEGWPAARRDQVPVNALVDGRPPDPVALRGFPCVKVKVGRPDLRADLALVEQVRTIVGDTVAMRVDANGAWDVHTAIRALRALAPFGLELAEQPVATIDELAAVRREVDVPIAADECVRSTEDAARLARLGGADVLVLKVQPLGGVRPALRIAEVAGLPAVVTSMRETSVGVAAGLALAAALPELPYACGLTAGMDSDVVHEPPQPVGGALPVRTVVPDPDLLERYAVSS